MAKNRDKHRQKVNERYRIDPEFRAKRLAYAKLINERNPRRQRRNNLQREYGISPEDYDRILADQGGVCGICLGPVIKSNGKFGAVDHDHSKKKGDPGFVRGVLCSCCNLGIGKFKDDPAIVGRALRWLVGEEHIQRVLEMLDADVSSATKNL